MRAAEFDQSGVEFGARAFECRGQFMELAADELHLRIVGMQGQVGIGDAHRQSLVVARHILRAGEPQRTGKLAVESRLFPRGNGRAGLECRGLVGVRQRPAVVPDRGRIVAEIAGGA